MTNIDPDPPAVDLMELVGIFHSDELPLADFEPVLDSQQMPEPFRRLLDHHSHMTVTVEDYHHSKVDVRVLQTKYGVAPLRYHSSDEALPDIDHSARWYAREILLLRQSDQRVVQYGIVRLNIDLLAPEVWEQIRSEKTPLGRVLIEHDVLREVELCRLWKVCAQSPLARLLNLRTGQTTYGRTARIFCDYLPAIELLEIVTIDGH